MNRIDLTQVGGFPLTQDTLDFMQSAYGESIGAVATLLGDKVILTGCETQNNVVLPGIVAVDGEILLTPGGASTTVFVEEQIETAVFEDGAHKEAYYRRRLAFGIGTPQYNWSDFKRLSKIVDLMGSLVPAGAIMMWFGSTESVPAGWALCNGANGTPDLRGRFPVGAGTDYTLGQTGGEAKHTLTASETPSHAHSLTVPGHSHDVFQGCYGTSGAWEDVTLSIWGGDHDSGNRNFARVNRSTTAEAHYRLRTKTTAQQVIQSTYTGGNMAHENRPPFLALNFIMKL